MRKAKEFKFIQRHWDTLAALAYEGYLRDGRGIIMINARATICHTEIAFIGQRAAQISGDSEQHKVVAYLVLTYAPETQVVVIIRRRDGGFSIYRQSPGPGQLTPLAAYQKRQGIPTIQSA